MQAQNAYRATVEQVVAWAGAALFAGALGYFLFSYSITYAESVPTGTASGAVGLDVLLFTLFATHHSVFARPAVRASMSRLWSPRLERSVYVWVASLMLVFVCAAWQPVPGVLWQVRGVAGGALWIMQAVGVWLTLRSAAVLDIWELAGVRQVRPSTPAPPQFKTAGPYRWVRHPIYLGWFLIVFPVSTMTMTRLVFAVVSSAYVLLAIPLEERSMRHAASASFDDYARKVPWRLIPGVY